MIIDRYILREFLKINALLVALLGLFYVVADFLDNSRYFIKYGASWSTIGQYYMASLPKILLDAFPFTVLFAAILTLWIFARNGEISAMRAAGCSVFRVSMPLIGMGFALSVLAFLVGEFVVPRSQLMLRYVETVKIKKKEYDPMFLESKWVRGTGSILHFERFDPLSRVLYGPQYYVFVDVSRVKTFAYANRAVFDDKTWSWKLEDAVVTSFTANGEIKGVSVEALLPTTVSSEPPRILREGITSDQLSYRELRDLIRLSARSGGNLADRQVDLQQKLALPFANLLFIFLALPFALRRERQADTYVSVVICLVAAIVYWIGNASMKSLAQNGLLNPVVAAWAVNVLFLVGAIVILRKLDRGT